MNLNGILIGSEDPQRLADYYRKLFGEPGWDGGGYTGWLIGSGSITVGPHSEVHGAKNNERHVCGRRRDSEAAVSYENDADRPFQHPVRIIPFLRWLPSTWCTVPGQERHGRCKRAGGTGRTA